MNFVCFEGSPLLRLEHHAVGSEVSNSVEGTVSPPDKYLF